MCTLPKHMAYCLSSFTAVTKSTGPNQLYSRKSCFWLTISGCCPQWWEGCGSEKRSRYSSKGMRKLRAQAGNGGLKAWVPPILFFLIPFQGPAMVLQKTVWDEVLNAGTWPEECRFCKGRSGLGMGWRKEWSEVTWQARHQKRWLLPVTINTGSHFTASNQEAL